MFQEFYRKAKEKYIDSDREEYFKKINDIYSYCISLNDFLYEKSGRIRTNLDNKKILESKGLFGDVKGVDVNYALIYNLNSVIISLIYNKILGLEGSKGTANIVRSGIENIGVMNFYDNNEDESLKNLFRFHYRIQEFNFAKVYFGEIKGEEVNQETIRNYDYAIKLYMDYYKCSKKKAERKYKQPMGWLLKDGKNVSVFAFLKENLDENLVRKYQLASMHIYNYEISNLLKEDVDSDYFLITFFNKLDKYVAGVNGIYFNNKNISLTEDYNGLINPKNNLHMFAWEIYFKSVYESIEKYKKIRLSDKKIVTTLHTKLMIESQEFFIDTCYAYFFGLTDPIRFKYKIILENTCIINTLSDDKNKNSNELLEVISKFKCDNLIETDSGDIANVNKVLSRILKTSMEMDVTNKTLGFLVNQFGKIPQIREMLENSNYAFEYEIYKDHYTNEMRDNAIGSLKSYYLEANYVDHPSMYQYVGWYGMDVVATQEIVPLILGMIANNFINELKDYIGKIPYAIANEDEEKKYSSIIRELSILQKDFSDNIRLIMKSISSTKSLRHKENVEGISLN